MRKRSPAAPQPNAAMRDLLAVAAAGIGAFALAARVEFHELFSRWVAGLERWQVDELPLTLLALSLGTSWFAWRRWREMRRELAWRAAAERDVGLLLARNRELSQRLITLQERERQEIAHELHDELGQCCLAIRAETAFLGRELPAGAPLRESVDAIADTAETLQQGVRRILQRLRPAALDALGLSGALHELCGQWRQHHGIACCLDCAAELDGIGDPCAISIYRVVQEALTNVARHAGASSVRVSVDCAAGTLRLSIRDDGRGLDPRSASHGLGLLGMRERVGALDGSMELHSEPGCGLRLEISIPLPHCTAPVPSPSPAGGRPARPSSPPAVDRLGEGAEAREVAR